MPHKTEYVAVQVQIVGSLDNYGYAYYSDLERFSTRAKAVRHGIETYGHDDFLLAHLRGNTLVMTSWQDDDRPDEADERAQMAAEFFWEVK